MDANNPYRAAGLMLRIYGHQAVLHVAARLIELRVLDDAAGILAWANVMNVLVELKAVESADGTVH